MAAQDFTRREIVRILGVAAVAAHSPAFARWRYAGAHPLADVAGNQPTKFVPQFFSATEFALIKRLAELIIPSDETPGAREAGVAEFVDFMVAHDFRRAAIRRCARGSPGSMRTASGMLGRPFLELTQAAADRGRSSRSRIERNTATAETRGGSFSGACASSPPWASTPASRLPRARQPGAAVYPQSPACPHRGSCARPPASGEVVSACAKNL